MAKREIGVEERLPLLQTVPLSHAFVRYVWGNSTGTGYFGDPATILLMNGIGTLLYLLICKDVSRLFRLEFCVHFTGSAGLASVWL